jgi:hypothetical protein
MKQILQNLRSGKVSLVEVPSPVANSGQVLIETRASLISAGMERMLTEFGSASLIGKARQQPDKVKQVLNKIRTDRLFPTLEAVFKRLDELYRFRPWAVFGNCPLRLLSACSAYPVLCFLLLGTSYL